MLILLFFIISCNLALAQIDKSEVYKEFIAKFNDAEAVSLNFDFEEANLSGSLLAGRNGKFKVVAGGRIITCDGETIWNYSPDAGKVVVSNAKLEGEGIRLDDIFFSIAENYAPVKLTKSTSTNKENLLKLTLNPKNPDSKIKDIREIIIVFEPEKHTVRGVKAESETVSYAWKVADLKFLKEVENSEFVFNKPEDCEIVDLR